jgi:DMSO/TMAO reductase YedYZ molybdopterin-dependent catalytic subunit
MAKEIPDNMADRLSRRKFIIALGLLVAGCRPAYRDNAPTAYAPGSATSTPVPSPAPATPQTTAPKPIPASVPVTDISKLYEKSFRLVPKADQLSDFTLTIDGLVESPLTLTIQDLRALPSIESMRVLQCIGNPVGGSLVGNLNWQGTLLAPLLARAKIKPTATHALFKAADGYTTSVELKWITQEDSLLVYGANGADLPIEHGHPLRLLMRGLYGQKMPKWITNITFADHDKLGYWEGPSYEWSNIASVKTNSRLFEPDRRLDFTNPIRIEGMAFGGGRAITAVEVSVNGMGRDAVWYPATLIKPPTPLAWTWWVYDWQPTAPGDYKVAVRAYDETGYYQSEPATGLMAGAYPNGTNAIHVQAVTLQG